MNSGNWKLMVCGLNHKSSTVEQREPYQIGHDELAEANAALGNHPAVYESLVLATCNRVEFYMVTDGHNDPCEIVADVYNEIKSLSIDPVRDLLLIRKGQHVAAHLFHVAAGLDSMVLGENQIISQLKDAYSSACATRTAGKLVHRIFHQAFRVSKQIRTDTEMGKGACSVSSAAVELLKHELQNTKKPTVLLIGVNQMIKLAANGVRHIDGANMLFANRTAEKAETFAGQYGGTGGGLDQLGDMLTHADAVVSCTSAPGPILTVDLIDQSLRDRADRPCVMIDLAIPRDIESNGHLPDNTKLLDLEAIKGFANEQQKRRESSIPRAEEIIDQRLAEFTYWYNNVLHEPLYGGHSSAIESIRQEELGKLLDKLPPELQKELQSTTQRLVDRVIQVTGRAKSDQME